MSGVYRGHQRRLRASAEGDENREQFASQDGGIAARHPGGLGAEEPDQNGVGKISGGGWRDVTRVRQGARRSGRRPCWRSGGTARIRKGYAGLGPFVNRRSTVQSCSSA